MYADAARLAIGQFRMADRRGIYCFCRGNPHSTKAWKNCAMTRHTEKNSVRPFLSSRMMHRFAGKLAFATVVTFSSLIYRRFS